MSRGIEERIEEAEQEPLNLSLFFQWVVFIAMFSYLIIKFIQTFHHA